MGTGVVAVAGAKRAVASVGRIDFLRCRHRVEKQAFVKNVFGKLSKSFQKNIEHRFFRWHPGVENGVSEGQQGSEIDVVLLLLF